MLINYYKGLPDLPRKCQDWEDREKLYDDQKDFIKAFSKRSEESFKVNVDAANYTNSPPPQKPTKENWSETAEKIKTLGELREKGLITQEEYNDKKRKLLEQF